MNKLIELVAWLFSKPTGPLRRRVTGYWWRFTWWFSLTVFFGYPILHDLLPGLYAEIKPGIPVTGTLQALQVFVTTTIWFLTFAVLSLFIYAYRLLRMFFFGIADDRKQEVLEFEEKERKQKAVRAVAEKARREELRRTRQHIRLNQGDSLRVKRIWTATNQVVGAAAGACVILVIYLYIYAPVQLREAPEPWRIFAEIIEVLPVHVFLLGIVTFSFFWVAINSISRRFERKILEKYNWNGSSNYEIHLAE